MSEEVKKSDVAYLILDDERANLLNAVFSYAYRNPEFQKFLDRNGADKALTEFFEDFNRKFHENGWCHSPTCSYKLK